MEYTLEKDEKLASIAKGIPNNAKYTSKDIQNEIIQTLADMVLFEVRKKYESADSAGFCLKSDGTRDRCNVGYLSVIIRFVRNSMPEEHLIGLLDLQQLDAEYITSEILLHLSDADYSADSILSQCYDGASVMSGVRGGVQALLQKRLDRYVPYIHCYNHQLHLVVVHAMQSEPCAKRFFSLSSSLYNFFHHHYMLNKHDAPCLNWRLEIRWTSHYEVTRCTVDNQEQILSILSEMTEDDDAAVDLCTEASGLLCQIKRHHFFEIGKFLVRVLGVLKPENAILQSQSVDLCSASEVLSAALDSLKNIREDDCWVVSSPAVDESHPTKRRRTMSKYLGQSIVLSTLGHRDSGDPTISPPSVSEKIPAQHP
ncbi:zinc finger protein 862-like [Erpetoichthys calabaricus]|uniref:zinc finger protein 862-like n=1 Tax=Erpetoichthys calabaricus TaxID=27687 RepID=UPI002233F5B5|nr:zinc finger protein 862-like [Erpetoichthys calabaricus]